MEYKIIFPNGYNGDDEWLDCGGRFDVLILHENGNYYKPNFVTLERIRNMFEKEETCFLEWDLVIVHEPTKDVILKSIKDLHCWQFTKHWHPLSTKNMEEIQFTTKADWVVFTINIDD